MYDRFLITNSHFKTFFHFNAQIRYLKSFKNFCYTASWLCFTTGHALFCEENKEWLSCSRQNLLVLPMLVIAVNSRNLAHQHWEDKKTATRPNNFDWDCCITDVQAWMVANRLKINDTKMEFLFVGSRQQLSKVQLELITVEDSEISIRNPGVYFMAFMWAKSAVRSCAIYILSDWSENIYR